MKEGGMARQRCKRSVGSRGELERGYPRLLSSMCLQTESLQHFMYTLIPGKESAYKGVLRLWFYSFPDL